MITYCYAEPSNAVMHETAHAGAAYAVTHIVETVCVKSTSDKNKLVCTIVGMVAANVANVAYKANENFPNDTKRAILSGLTGSALAGIVINF